MGKRKGKCHEESKSGRKGGKEKRELASRTRKEGRIRRGKGKERRKGGKGKEKGMRGRKGEGRDGEAQEERERGK